MEITKREFKIINNKFDEFKANTNKSFDILKGKEKVFLSAPHSVRQLRNGIIKGKDSCTGTIAITLQKAINCYCIYKTKNCDDDANYDIENNSILEATFEIQTTDMDCHENYINFKDHGKTEYGVKVGDIIINKTTRERFRVEQVPDYHGIYWQSEYKLSLLEDYTSSYRSLSEDFILIIWDE